ncbi:Ytp1 domain-containing protein [Phanerochaete sordida]|uniref:Ytp1 domain-containing protein n=1 Tax=Phanerochaete sordida TaxID=48140 RepID=A0A9P3GQ30_9APHY|nr:Ytp1 domain-containing protein [Phanerochaete sordida]
MPRRTLLPAAAAVLSLAAAAAAHEHHEHLDEEAQNKPVDAILWIHIFLQMAVWGVLFPTGMVLGLSKSRWHVPLQSVGIALTLGGYILGHAHGGRAFLAGIHGLFANIMLAPIFLQLALGIYLKLHIHEESVRPWAVRFHSVVGKAYPVIGWAQMLFGAVAFRGYCRGGNLGQCLAHYIMGSGFIAYGIIMAIMLLVGEAWIRRSQRSPEWWDSWIIMLWGIVNTFTEHHGGGWSHKDMQHTVLGVVWWAGGLLGILLARNNQRTVVPSIIMILTGWAFSEHAQSMMISTKIHAVFGDTLMLAGVARIVEVSFLAPRFAPLPPDAPSDDGTSEHTLADAPAGAGAPYHAVQAFRHLPPFLLVAAGVLFMSATDEELRFVDAELEMDHVTYTLVMFSLAFLIYALAVSRIRLWASSGRHAAAAQGDGAIELAPAGKWYARVPGGEPEGAAHVIGDDDDE